MKILQIIPFFTPARGGSVIVPYYLSKELIKMGHEVTIITTDFEFDPEFAKSIENIKVIPFKCIANIGLFLYSPKMKKWLKDNIQNYDILHLHNLRSYQNNIALHYSKKYSTPIILQPHASTPRKYVKIRLKWLYDILYGYKIMRSASKVIAVSKEEAEYDKEMGANEENVIVIYNGMDVEPFINLPKRGTFRKRIGLDNNVQMVLYLGRIHKLKGLDFLIDSFSKISNDSKNVQIIIAGADDGYGDELRKSIEEKGLNDKVKIVGYIKEEEKINVLVDSDIFIHTVRYMGGVGLVPLEAILCGIPVIVTKACGEIIIEANCGYVVEYGKIEDLSDKLSHILENPEEGKRLAQKGREYLIQNYTWQSVSKKVEKLYESCINNP